ncbi:MAG: hypothetical protein APF80_13360 [Alphaproteobacteria bacterium BRH_c36]|nr:MAG: hypothetical protein APF80_13360 [Alphaproteobacteria bacterium BRH_c36]
MLQCEGILPLWQSGATDYSITARKGRLDHDFAKCDCNRAANIRSQKICFAGRDAKLSGRPINLRRISLLADPGHHAPVGWTMPNSGWTMPNAGWTKAAFN